MDRKELFYYVTWGSSITHDVHWCVTVFYLTIRLWARDFYEVIVDEAEGRISYHLIEIESE